MHSIAGFLQVISVSPPRFGQRLEEPKSENTDGKRGEGHVPLQCDRAWCNAKLTMSHKVMRVVEAIPKHYTRCFFL